MTTAGWLGRVQAQSLMPPLALAIAKEAFIYGYPMVMNYGNMFAYAIAMANPQYKAPFNELANEAKVFHTTKYHGHHSQPRHAILNLVGRLTGAASDPRSADGRSTPVLLNHVR
jgi:hypothetical protein